MSLNWSNKFLADLKASIIAESKSWKVFYGRQMNKKYSTLLDSTLEQIDDLSKRLSRPIKDLDDIRIAMQALKEIRENEIQIDMSLVPIEVSQLSVCVCVCLFVCK